MIPPEQAQIDAVLHERAFALILGALILNDAGHDVDLAWRVAEMAASLDGLRRNVPPDPHP